MLRSFLCLLLCCVNKRDANVLDADRLYPGLNGFRTLHTNPFEVIEHVFPAVATDTDVRQEKQCDSAEDDGR